MTAVNSNLQMSGEGPIPRILIVDDNQTTARSIAKVLESQRFAAVMVFRGAEALEAAKNGNFAAALVDVHLPDLNGLVVAQKLRETFGPDVPIIVVSGDTSMEVINALSHVGATYFLSKPLNIPYLLERMKEWTGRLP